MAMIRSILRNYSTVNRCLQLQSTQCVFRDHKHMFDVNKRSVAMARYFGSHTDAYYNKISTAGIYDKVRPITVGVDVIAGTIMTHHGPGIKNIRILDAGCGTGAPARDLLEYGFQNISLIDSSVGMLQLAKEKLKQELENGLINSITKATLPYIPFPDESFEVVLFSWVLHHLVIKPDGSTFTEIVEALKATRRVLCKDGLLIILTLTPFQLQEGVWWMQLLPDVTARYVQHYPNIEQWDTIFKECKFQCQNRLSLLGRDIQGPWYLDEEGPLKKEWRDAFTYFNMTSADDEKELNDKMIKMKHSGNLKEWMKQNDKTNEYGYGTILVAKTE